MFSEERCDMREIGKVENQAGRSILDKLQVFDGTSGDLFSVIHIAMIGETM